MGEPLRTPDHGSNMPELCELGGAAAIRCQGLADIAAIKGRCEVPVIGLVEGWTRGAFLHHADAASRSRLRCRQCRHRGD